MKKALVLALAVLVSMSTMACDTPTGNDPGDNQATTDVSDVGKEPRPEGTQSNSESTKAPEADTKDAPENADTASEATEAPIVTEVPVETDAPIETDAPVQETVAPETEPETEDLAPEIPALRKNGNP